ncbi:MAG: SigB/SigF/SigG family RNA polymerase sigma factor [Acidimicrobiales bacterium]|nr:SigB/SigF/SigG family RNA polymerase sigma factor [Acidimicrobiales bacterium]HRW38489.1 SigB/SigF/SigG family RNA polymerase sigma factor [Aquihabitans sp.]
MSQRDDDGDPVELLERFEELRRSGSQALRNQLVTEHLSLAEACARRFANRGEPLDDLEQVAMVGLVKAVERFDPRQGVPFAGFAVPTITGELRRHFRDATWALKVPRGAKDLHVKIPGAIERLGTELGRAPTPEEIAESLGVPLDHVIDALDAGAAYRTASTDTTEGAAAAGHATARRSNQRGGLGPEDRVLLEELLTSLPERERTIVWLRFFEDLSQSEIAARVGMSQVHVSRLLRRSLRALREQVPAEALAAGDG